MGAGRVQAPIVSGRRLAVALTLAALTTPLVALAAEPAASPDAVSCSARSTVDEFVAAIGRGDLDRLDSLFAGESEGWAWYSVADRSGQRLGVAARKRATLRSYFAERVRQHEQLRIVEFTESSSGNFTFRLQRRADDLFGERLVVRLGKGRVVCEAGQIGVWSLGGAPLPPTFGPCPRDALPVSSTNFGAARAAVMRWVGSVYSQVSPAIDVRGLRATGARTAVGTAVGYRARVKCGREIQRRTVIVTVRFPRMSASSRLASTSFYASRTRTGWLVWFRVD